MESKTESMGIITEISFPPFTVSWTVYIKALLTSTK